MAVRVRVTLSPTGRGGKSHQTVALCNSGFEAERPEIVLPARLAGGFGLSRRCAGARVDRYVGPAGVTRMLWVPRAVRVQVVRGPSAEIVCDAAVSETEPEMILNDAALGELRLTLVDPRAGQWCYRGASEVCESDPAELWPPRPRRGRTRR